MRAIIENLKQRFLNFWKSPTCKYQILCLGLAIAFLIEGLTFNENYARFQREFTLYRCIALAHYDTFIDEFGRTHFIERNNTVITNTINYTNITP